MSPNSFIRHALQIEQDKPCVDLDEQGVAAALESDILAWAHLDRDHPDTRKWVEANLSFLDPLIIDALFDEETRPRAEEFGDGLLVNLPVADPSGSLGLALGKIGSSLIQLELSAMQLEDRGEVISSPRVITSNQQEASIQQGVEIPYQEATSSGATSISFKEAVLELKVTPQITPDDNIIMDLKVSKDNVGEVFFGVPSVDTRNVRTRVLVENGETLVLGGIYEQERGKQVERIPFFGSLPGVGWLFKTESRTDQKQELLIFVTPKIIKQGMAAVDY